MPAPYDLTIKQMEDAHAAIAEEVEKVQTVRMPWRTSAGPELAAQLIAATEDLSARVDTHLEDEEQNILPLINQPHHRRRMEELRQARRGGACP